MLLIDGSKTSSGGALGILKLLLEKLQQENKDFFLIKDTRWKEPEAYELPHYENNNVLFTRGKVIKQLISKHSPHALLCFYSFPPPLDLPSSIKTFTYFQNPNLLDVFDRKGIYSKLKDVSWFFKKKYLKKYKDNTDYFVFQTPYIRDHFITQYSFPKEKTLLYPYYDENRIENTIQHIQNGGDQEKSYDFSYISLAYPHKNHLNLIDAFTLIKKRYGESPSLILTVPEGQNTKVDNAIRQAQHIGVNIINVGLVSYEDALKYTNLSKYSIFPSTRETLGLGLVEACKMNKVILTSDIPVIQDVIKPSATFNPNSAKDMSDVIMQAVNGKFKQSKLILPNKLGEFVDLLYN